MRNFKSTPTPPVLSVEEEAILMDEQKEQAAAIDEAANETERMGDIIVSMGEAQAVVSNTPEIGVAEQSLVAAVAEMAVAGTDADPEEVAADMLPPSEELSAEALSDTIKNALVKIWEAIKKGMAKVWEHILAFFRTVSKFFAGTKRRIDRLEGVIGQANQLKAGGEPVYFHGPNDVLMIKREVMVHNIGRNYKEAQDWALAVIRSAAAQGKLAMNGGLKLVEKLVVDADAVESDIMMNMADLEHPMSTLVKDTHLTKVDVTLGWTSDGAKDVLGGLQFEGRLPRFGSRNKSTENSLEYYDNALRLNVTRRYLGYDGHKIKVPLSTNAADLKSILDGSKRWVSEIEKDTGLVNDVFKHAEAVRSKIDELLKKVGDGADSAQTKKNMAAVLSINGKINTMIGMVIFKVTNHGSRMANGLLDYAIQSCEQVTHGGAGHPKP